MRRTRKMQQLIERMARDRNIDLSQPEAHFKVKSGGFMDLVVENIGINQISVTHYYTQNGDMIQDPEVVFLIGCDGEWYPVEWTTPAVMLMGRVIGGWKRYIEIDAKNGTWVRGDLRGQKDLAVFANKWADNLRNQGFK